MNDSGPPLRGGGPDAERRATQGRSGRVGRWALASLLLALAAALGGLALRESGVAPFGGGLLLAFGEAALVGGLADWFAVRALFVRPLGLPFPHAALIPRNRRRLVAQIRQLVLTEWLPPQALVARLESLDLVGDALVPLLGPARPHLRVALRDLGRDLLARADVPALADAVARALAGAAGDDDRLRLFLADLVARARERDWLHPLLREWALRFYQWAESDESRRLIHERLNAAADAYRERGWFKSLTFQVAEVFGGVDLEDAARHLQREMSRFALDQLSDQGQLKQIVRDGLSAIEARLRDEPAFLFDVRSFLTERSRPGALAALLGTLLESLRREGAAALKTDGGLLDWAAAVLDRQLERIVVDAVVRQRVNEWCRRLAVRLVEQHHDALGGLVEAQMERLSDERLVALIESRVGEDLNWIRLNGTFVGGLIGVGLFLAFHAATWALR
jgi:uncharacterized membrane-anchored protein YjiN (DUF445 family)